MPGKDADLTAKRKLFALLRTNYTKNIQKNCVISTMKACPFGAQDLQSQKLLEGELAAFFGAEKALEKINTKIAEFDKEALEETRRGYLDVSQDHLQAVTKKLTGIDPLECGYSRKTPDKVDRCTRSFAVLCETLRMSQELVDDSKAKSSQALEQMWDQELNPEAESNPIYEAERKELCDTPRFSAVWRNRSFNEWRLDNLKCRANPTTDRCKNISKLYQDYQGYFTQPARPDEVITMTPEPTVGVDRVRFRTVPPPPPVPDFMQKPQPTTAKDDPLKAPPSQGPKEKVLAKEVESSTTTPDPATVTPTQKTQPTLPAPSKDQVVSEQQVSPASTPTEVKPFVPPVPLAAPVTPTPVPTSVVQKKPDPKQELETSKPEAEVDENSDSKDRKKKPLPSKSSRSVSSKEDEKMKSELDQLRSEMEMLRGELAKKKNTPETPTVKPSTERFPVSPVSQTPVQRDESVGATPTMVSGNMNASASVKVPSTAAAATAAVERINKISSEVPGVEGTNSVKTQPVTVRVGNTSIVVSQSVLSGKQVDSLTQVTGEITSQQQFALTVDSSVEFQLLKQNDSATVAKYIQQYMKENKTAVSRDGVLVLTDQSGESIYLSIVSEESGTFAQQFKPKQADEKVLRTAELRWLQQLVRSR